MTGTPAAALLELAAALGLPAAELRKSEGRDDVAYSATVPAKLPDRAKLDPLLQKLLAEYGDSIAFQVRTGELPLYSLQDGATLDHLYQRLPMLDTIEIDVRLDKTRLLTSWGVRADSCVFRLYLFPEQLADALSVPLFDLKQKDGLLSEFDTASKIVLLVPGHAIHLDGPFLAVLGGEAAQQWSACAVAPSAVTPAPADVRRHARKRLKWVQYDIEPLTPLHFAVAYKQKPAADDPVAGALYAQWAACSILYLADHSRWNEESQSWQVTFAAEKFTVAADVGKPETIRIALGGEWSCAEALGGVVSWVYEEEKQVSDHLTVVQNVVANELEENDAAVNARELILQADEIRRRAEGAWKAFIAQKLDKYFGQVKQFEEAIDSTTRAYDEQIQLLTKSLSDNMLAAVAVVVGSFIAAMLKSPFQAYAFWFGAGVYLAYLIVFPVGVGLTATWKRFGALQGAFGKRRSDFEKRLTKNEVAEIAGSTVQKRESAFYSWFSVTLLLYLAVVVTLIVAMAKVPRLIERWGDDFDVTRIEVGGPSSGTIPMKIHGTNFDRNREIVVIAGSSAYANSEKSVTVYGSTLLTLSVRESDLPSGKAVRVTVRQGKAESVKTLQRP